MEENLAGHVSFLPGVTEGMLVEAASDLPTHTFNAVCRAKLGRDSATRQRIEESILHVRSKCLPLSW